MEFLIYIENLIFNIDQFDYEDSIVKIKNGVDNGEIEIPFLIYFLSYCCNFRIKNIPIYLNIVKDIVQQDVQLSLSTQDFFMKLLEDNSYLKPDQDGFIISEKYSTGLNDTIENIIMNDDAEQLAPYLTEQLPSTYSNRFLELCALCGSNQCFSLLEGYINPDRFNKKLMTNSYIGGSEYIMNYLHNIWENITINANDFLDMAFQAHRYELLPPDYEFNIVSSCLYFSTYGISQCENQNINSDYQEYYGKKLPLFYFLLLVRGENYIRNISNMDNFIKYCLLHDREHAVQYMKPATEFINDFSFKWENNSCYCNCILKMLFNIEDVQLANFLDNTCPTNCEYQLAIIQYLIQTQRNDITTEYFRYSTQHESNLAFGMQQDAAEQFAFIFKNCRIIESLFSVTHRELKLCYFKKDGVPTLNIVSSEETHDEMYISNDGYYQTTTIKDLGIDFTCSKPYFGKYFSYEYITKLSKYVIIRYNNFAQNIRNFNFNNVHLSFIGGTSLKNNHYIYYELVNGQLIPFNDYPSLVHASPKFTLCIYKNAEPNARIPEIQFKCNIENDWSNRNQVTNHLKLHDIISANRNLFSSPVDHAEAQNLLESFYIDADLDVQSIPTYTELFEDYQDKIAPTSNQKINWSEIININYSIKHEFDPERTLPTHFTNSHLLLEKTKKNNELKSINKPFMKAEEVIDKVLNPLKKTRTKKVTKIAQQKSDDNLLSSIDYYKSLFFKYRALYANQKRITNIYCGKLEMLEKRNQELENDAFNNCDDFVKMLLTIKRRNTGRPPCKFIYTEEEKQKCLGVFLYSKRVYQDYLKHWILPSISLMKSRQRSFLQSFHFQDFTSSSLHAFDNVLHKWLSVFPFKQTPAILAIDAMCVSTRIELKGDKLYGLIPEELIDEKHRIYMNNCAKSSFSNVLKFIFENKYDAEAIFVINLIPLTNEKPCIVHYELAHSGSATLAIYQKLINFINHLAVMYQDQIICYGGAADADPQYKKIHKVFRNAWLESMLQEPSKPHIYIANIPPSKCFSPDLNHLGKRLKYRSQTKQIKHLICVDQTIQFDEIITFFNAKTSWNEFNNSSFTKMNDDAVHDYFTPANLELCLERNEYKYIEMFLPPMLLNICFYDQYINRKGRLYALLIGFYFMFYIYESIHNPEFETNHEFTKDNAIYLNDQIKDYMNLCVQHIKVLTEVKGSFSMARLGTLNNEHLFSTTRYMTYGDESSVANENAIQKIIAMRYLEDEHITKKSHSKYPPAIVEAEIYKLTQQDVDTANYIAQYLLILCEGPGIINPNYLLVTDINNREPYDLFLELLHQWDMHYFYPNHKTTNRTLNDGHSSNHRIVHRYIGNSRARNIDPRK